MTKPDDIVQYCQACGAIYAATQGPQCWLCKSPNQVEGSAKEAWQIANARTAIKQLRKNPKLN